MLHNPRSFFPHPAAGTPAGELQAIVQNMVAMRRPEGAKRAVSRTARDLGLTESRVAQLLRGNVGRVWADEWIEARRRYDAFLASQERIAADQAAACRMARTKIATDWTEMPA